MKRIFLIFFPIFILLGCSEQELKEKYLLLTNSEIVLHCVGKRTLYYGTTPTESIFDENWYYRIKFEEYPYSYGKKGWVIRKESDYVTRTERSENLITTDISSEKVVGVTDSLVSYYFFSTNKKDETLLNHQENIDRYSGVWSIYTEMTNLKTKRISIEKVKGICKKSNKKF